MPIDIEFDTSLLVGPKWTGENFDGTKPNEKPEQSWMNFGFESIPFIYRMTENKIAIDNRLNDDIGCDDFE